MDRSIVYPGAIPLDTDILNAQQRAMVAVGGVLRAAFGEDTLLDGMACVPTIPASMSVTVDPGSIISVQALEPTQYGSLSADSSDSLVKMGINVSGTSFTLTAPTTPGQSINYLIEGTFLEADSSPTVLPYYNSANPSQPFSGPGNTGVPQNTVRTQRASLELKAGAPANTGTQTTPAVDVGYVGMWVITVNYGQVSITASSIKQYAGAPFIIHKLSSLDIRTRLTSNFVCSVAVDGDDGAAAASPGTTAFRTIQAAVNYIQDKLDLNGFATGISVGPGTFTGEVKIYGSLVGAPAGFPMAINGAGPSTIIHANDGVAIAVSGGASIIIGQMTISASSNSPLQLYRSAGYGVTAAGGGSVGINQGVVFGACDVSHITAQDGGSITTGGNPYTVTGGGLRHFTCGPGGHIATVDSAVTISGNPAFSDAFAYAYGGGGIEAYNTSYSGSVSGAGKKFYAVLCGNINVNGAGLNLFPGTAAGVTTAGGAYA